METKFIKLDKLQPNTGQIKGLPKNPRLIKDAKFEKLVKSIRDDPEMLELRELIVYQVGKAFVVIGGNMRLQAMTGFMTPTNASFFCPGKYKRPKIEIEIRKCSTKEWHLFKKYHYMSTDLNPSAHCYIGYFENNPVCFFAVLHFPHPSVRNLKKRP